MLQRYPPAIPHNEVDWNLAEYPGGAGHYVVIYVEFDPTHGIVTRCHINGGVVCKEQLVQPQANGAEGQTEMWPTGALQVLVADPDEDYQTAADAAVDEGLAEWVANGLWIPASDEEELAGMTHAIETGEHVLPESEPADGDDPNDMGVDYSRQ